MRDLAWQEDKQEILAEVQRLKEEASRMVAILTMEAEDEMGEEKKRSLQQEVESLQLVVEMRTAEVKRLRDQQAKMERQLEEFGHSKEQQAGGIFRLKAEGGQDRERIDQRMSFEVEQIKWDTSHPGRRSAL